MSEKTSTEYILIALIAVSLLVSVLSYTSISPIAKTTKELSDSIDALSTDLSEGIEGIITKLGEEPIIPDDEEPSVEGPQTFTVGYWGDPPTLDPQKTRSSAAYHANQYPNDLYFLYDENGVRHNHLFESFEESADGLTYTMHLKRGVKFHCGEPFNAEAVKFSFERGQDPSNPNQPEIDSVDYVEVVDEYTVKLHMKKRDVNLLHSLSLPRSGIPLCKKCVEEWGGKYGIEHICGTGPFKFVEWVDDDYIEYERNPDYNWGPEMASNKGPANLEKVIIEYLPEQTTRISALMAGEIDLILIKEAFSTVVPMLEANPDFTVYDSDSYAWWALWVQTGPQSILSDINLRRAIAYATNKDDYIRVYGSGVPIYSCQSEKHAFYNRDAQKGLEYDLDKANQLLDDLGWVMADDGFRYKDGEKLVVNVLTSGTITSFADAAVVCMGQLREVGIQTELDLADSPTWYERLDLGDFDISVSWAATPSIIIHRRYWHSQNIGRGNDMGWNDTETDMLLDRAYSQPPAEAEKDFKKIQEIIVQNVVVIPTFASVEYHVFGNWVNNYRFPADVVLGTSNQWQLLDVYIDNSLKP